MTARWTASLFASFAVAAGAVACKGVLGLDAPELDPCAGGCPDAAATDASDAARTSDAAPDGGSVSGLRCGGGDFALTGCSGATPVCCQVTGDSGTPAYTCRASTAACESEGYPIGCASGSDCPGSEVCCHFNSSTKCEPVSACADDALVCDPAGPKDQCPTGWTCKAPVVNAGQVSPYFSCAP